MLCFYLLNWLKESLWGDQSQIPLFLCGQINYGVVALCYSWVSKSQQKQTQFSASELKRSGGDTKWLTGFISLALMCNLVEKIKAVLSNLKLKAICKDIQAFRFYFILFLPISIYKRSIFSYKRKKDWTVSLPLCLFNMSSQSLMKNRVVRNCCCYISIIWRLDK